MRRTVKKLIADPAATAEDIAWLRQKDPLAALHHPNCPIELWWELAREHPIEAAKSTLSPLALLEEPGRWEELRRLYISDWIEGGMAQLGGTESLSLLSLPAVYAFAADCAERALPLFENPEIPGHYSGDWRPRAAIQAARTFSAGQTTLSAFQAAANSAFWAQDVASTRSIVLRARPGPHPVRRRLTPCTQPRELTRRPPQSATWPGFHCAQ